MGSQDDLLVIYGGQERRLGDIVRTDVPGGLAPDEIHVVVWGGQRRLLAEVCRELGVRPQTIRSRMARGMSAQQALTRPVRRYWKRPRICACAEHKPPPPRSTTTDPDAELMGLLLDACDVLRGHPIRGRIRSWMQEAGWSA